MILGQIKNPQTGLFVTMFNVPGFARGMWLMPAPLSIEEMSELLLETIGRRKIESKTTSKTPLSLFDPGGATC